MKERPILFKGELVRAILDGRKTQTRRIVKGLQIPSPSLCDAETVARYPDMKFSAVAVNHARWGFSVFGETEEKCAHELRHFCPFGSSGDQLWVRETFYCDLPDSDPFRHTELYYRADGECCDQIPGCSCAEIGKPKWRPSIHMPRWASRIDLLIKNVRVERLQDISEKDAKAEGCPESWSSWEGIEPDECPIHHGAGTVGAFANLWDSVYKNWDANPWVWVIEFSKVEKSTT